MRACHFAGNYKNKAKQKQQTKHQGDTIFQNPGWGRARPALTKSHGECEGMENKRPQSGIPGPKLQPHIPAFPPDELLLLPLSPGFHVYKQQGWGGG